VVGIQVVSAREGDRERRVVCGGLERRRWRTALLLYTTGAPFRLFGESFDKAWALL
jgi:hypothetical protein